MLGLCKKSASCDFALAHPRRACYTDGRSLILVCEGEHQHIDHRSVEEQDKRREQDKFKKLASAYRMVEAFWIEHFEH